MNIIVANEQKADLLKSNFTLSEYKCATGKYTIKAIINTLANIDVDCFVIDETAVEDLGVSTSLEKLIKSINPKKIYLYLTKESMEDYILVCTLINIGIYNFESNIRDLNALLETPKTLEDVTVYRRVLSSKNTSRKSNVDISTRPLTEEEMSAKINDYMKANGIKKKEKTKYNNYLFQLFNGFIVYPILTFILTLLYYYYTNNIERIVEPIPGFKDGLSTIIIGKIITPLFLLAIVLGLLIMFIVDKVYDKIIKERTSVYRKLMLLPVLINFSIFALDFYVFHFIGNICSNYNFILNKYMIKGMESVAFGSSILLMSDYLIHNLFIKKNTLEFEKVLENGYKWWEGIDVAFIIFFAIISVAYIVLSTSFESLPLTSIISDTFHSKTICAAAILLSIKTIVFNFSYKIITKKERNA